MESLFQKLIYLPTTILDYILGKPVSTRIVLISPDRKLLTHLKTEGWEWNPEFDSTVPVEYVLSERVQTNDRVIHLSGQQLCMIYLDDYAWPRKNSAKVTIYG